MHDSCKSIKDGYKRDDLKAIFNLKLNSDEKKEKRLVISKILKFDENSQYGFAMKKPLPTGCIKERKETSFFFLFNLLFETAILKDRIGQLFVINIQFSKSKACNRQIIYNEIFSPIIEKD